MLNRRHQPNASASHLLQVIQNALMMDPSEGLVDLTNYLMSILLSLVVGLVGFITGFAGCPSSIKSEVIL